MLYRTLQMMTLLVLLLVVKTCGRIALINLSFHIDMSMSQIPFLAMLVTLLLAFIGCVTAYKFIIVKVA